jgi:hypothetical protein
MLLFLRRALRSDTPLRWAVGFALAVAGQLAAGVYPAMGSVFVGVIFLAALLVENGVSRRLVVPAIVATLIVAVLAYVMYAPYFALRQSGLLTERGRAFLAWPALVPDGGFFPGWLALGLAMVGAFGWVANASIPGEPDHRLPSRAVRVAGFVACVVITFLAIGGAFSVDPKKVWHTGASAVVAMEPSPIYERLAGWIPGINIGRAPAYMYGAAHLCLALLAGMGIAALVALPAVTSRGPRTVALTAGGLAAMTAIIVFGLRPEFVQIRQRPGDGDLAFYARLAAMKNKGPLLELPMTDNGLAWWDRASESVLLSAYHRRATSECFASFAAANFDDPVRRLVERVPDPEALRALAKHGFTTIVVHHEGTGKQLAFALTADADKPSSALRRLILSETKSAFTIR